MNKSLLKLSIISLACGVASCSKVDDYMLGKDNTPAPMALSQIKPEKQMRVVWSKPVGGKNSSSALKLSPIVKGNLIYTVDAKGNVSALNRNDGKLKWHSKLNASIVSGPVVAEGKLAVTSANADLIVLDSDSGKTLWSKALSNEALSPPAIAKGKIIVKSINGKLYAFDANSAKQLWIYDHGSPNLILRTGSAPAIVNNLVIAGFSDGKLEGINIANGQLLWQRSISYARGSSDVERLIDIDAKPIVDGATAYAANYQGFVTALSLTNGKFKWRHPLSTYKNMSLAANRLFITDSSDVVWALNQDNGKTVWHQDGLKSRHVTSPVNYGKDIVVADEFGYVHLLSGNDGHVKSRLQLSRSGVSSAPVVKDKAVFILSDNGMLSKIAIG